MLIKPKRARCPVCQRPCDMPRSTSTCLAFSGGHDHNRKTDAYTCECGHAWSVEYVSCPKCKP